MVKSRLNNLANFLAMLLVVALLIFVVYLARQNRKARNEYNVKIFAAQKQNHELRHALDKKDFLIKQLKHQLQQLKKHGGR